MRRIAPFLAMGATGGIDTTLVPVPPAPDLCDVPTARVTVVPDPACGEPVDFRAVEGPWDLAVAWTFGDPATEASDTMPVVGYLVDSNGDGVYAAPDVPVLLVAIAPHAGDATQIVALSGRDGTERWRTAPVDVDGMALTLVDLDDDGRPEVLTFDEGAVVRALTADGEPYWRSEVSHHFASAALAALRDGAGKVLVASDVFLLDGSNGELVAELGGESASLGHASFLSDLDLDGEPDWLARGAVWDPAGGLIWDSSFGSLTTTRMVPVQGDEDPEAELVITDPTGPLVLWEHDGRGRTGLVNVAEAVPSATPCLGDLTADGRSEYAWPTWTGLLAISLDGSTLWQSPWPPGVNAPGCSMADLDADGRLEILVDTYYAFRILDGRTGDVLYEAPAGSTARGCYPPVPADVDGDGHLEIIVSSSDGTTPITVYRHAGEGWAPGGVGWTSYEYSVTNSSPDGAVPARTAPSWLGYDMVRARPTAEPLPLADLAVALESNCDDDAVAVLVTNEGMARVPAGVEVVLAVDGVTVDALTLPSLASGEGLSRLVLTRGSTPGAAEVVVDPGGAVDECDRDDNRVAVPGD